MEKFHRSWDLFRRSVTVIRKHPKLLAFPLVTGLLTTLIAVFFLAPVVVLLAAPHWLDGTMLQRVVDNIGFARFHSGATFNFQLQPLGASLLAVIYLVNMFLATMSGVAFNHQIMEALSGRPVSLRKGIEAACDRWKSVLLWSLLAGLVGLIIRAVEERLAFVGRLVAGMIGLAWSVAAIFAIPILARDESSTNPFSVLSKSATIIKRTWGEMLIGFIGMRGSNSLIVGFSILFWIVIGAAALILQNPWLLLAGVPWLVSVIIYGYLASIASRVYLCALYLYASEGFVPDPYEPSMMTDGWRMKKASH